MFQHKLSDHVDTKTYLDWFLLSFLAGSINVGGYLACHRFVSHITGFATMSGLLFEQKEWMESLGTLLIPLFFLIGVIVSGYLTEKQHAHKVHGQKYAPVMGLVALLMLAVAGGGYFDYFGKFGDAANLKYDFVLLACLCGACGLQNAAITSASGATIRTTHLTGLTTDLGLSLVKSEVGEISVEQRGLERRANVLRVLTILFFTLGSVAGAFTYAKYQYLGFLLPAALALYFATQARRQNSVPN